ncbi:DUF1553 domain-containing protein [Neorhodopirellula pilleata]|uniref:Planctomycete cytochrome C n=1 Tax=Neorhodopirellula pilleata TaxID=2714738 RepID=A0A5C5ZJ46_9BACT|nr:DUF1553 domain-containing protein [Neorhodopirellula pilleata]TWT87027.1 Planctomycete cytochrome C [Neorhodopirellula pilleata]
MSRVLPHPTALLGAFLIFHWSVVAAEHDPRPGVSFDRDIRPLLSSRCFACHGPDAETREAGLRLDVATGDEAAIGFAIQPGSVEDSELWNRITSDDDSMLMPPPESHLKPLSAKEQELIRIWIESGAEYDAFWAFEPPTKSAPPEVQDPAWSNHPIDSHVKKKLESIGRRPSVDADPRTLIRRLTLDLTGLPPTRDEVGSFIEAYAMAPEQVWLETIDTLMARPQFGEHLARHWLDLVRFADTNGMHKDFYRNNVAYRDWVINAFNNNLSYDEFVRYQLAGDLYPEPTTDQLVASGFNRLHLIIDRGTALPEESFTKNVIDRVTAVGTAFMGLTVHCAQCHDHKFDPITQKDFYSLYAFFNNIDAAPETSAGPKYGIQEPFIRLGTPEQYEQLARLNEQIADVQKQTVEPAADGAVSVEAIEQAKAQREQQLKTLQGELAKLEDAIPRAMVMKEREEVRETFILLRGQYDQPGERVERGTPAFLPPLEKTGEVATRLDLANWLVDSRHPLTARVAVNRFWQLFFGVGLSKTAEDLGNQGEVPSHPELLDDLAVTFMESGWDTKALIKQIVSSRTYRQASHASPETFQEDPGNRLLARGPRYRLDAEVIRDQILATSGLLSPKMLGPSVKPPQPPGLWKAVSMIGETFKPDQGDAIYRRSVYTFWKRAMPPPQMTILNAPIRDACIARRERTNTPTQALLLLNESQYLQAARRLAEKTLTQSPDQRIDYIWETVTAKLPDAQERSVLESLLTDLKRSYTESPQLADALCQGVQIDSQAGNSQVGSTQAARAELAAWTIVGNTLYNLDITKTKD